MFRAHDTKREASSASFTHTYTPLLSQIGALSWFSGLVLYLYQMNNGVLKMSEAPYLQTIMTLLLGYLGFA